MDILSQLLPIAVSASGGFIIGLLIGYALKKALKVMAVIVGLFLLGLILMNYYGLITIDYTKLEELVKQIVSYISQESEKFTNWATVNISFAGSILAGLILGFKKG